MRRVRRGGSRDHLELLRSLYDEGKLNEMQARFASPERPAEELYDLEHDPHETRNLVHDPQYPQQLGELRTVLDRWIVETGDQGQFPKSDAALNAVTQRWGDQAVNQEYDRVR